VPAIPAVFDAVPHGLTPIPPILCAVAPVLQPVEEILKIDLIALSVLPSVAPVLLPIPPVLCAVPTVLQTVDQVLETIPAIGVRLQVCAKARPPVDWQGVGRLELRCVLAQADFERVGVSLGLRPALAEWAVALGKRRRGGQQRQRDRQDTAFQPGDDPYRSLLSWV
jgi:hypothetical protein